MRLICVCVNEELVLAMVAVATAVPAVVFTSVTVASSSLLLAAIVESVEASSVDASDAVLVAVSVVLFVLVVEVSLVDFSSLVEAVLALVFESEVETDVETLSLLLSLIEVLSLADLDTLTDSSDDDLLVAEVDVVDPEAKLTVSALAKVLSLVVEVTTLVAVVSAKAVCCIA